MATKEKEKSDRDIRWEAFLESYKKANPAKYAIKEAKGEFKAIPNTFA